MSVVDHGLLQQSGDVNMDIFLFLSAKDHRFFGLTQDKDGKNLPADRAPWEAKGSPMSEGQELARFGAPTTIISTIATKGSYVARRVPKGRLAGRWDN